MLIRCPECGKRISDRVEVCPYCGIPQPASLRIAALKQRRVARRKAIRVVATIVIVTAVAAATTFSFVYRWPISYEVGAVSGTDTVSREDLEKIVDYAAATWNRAAGRTVAWRVPLGRRVKFDIEFDKSLQEYLTTLAGLEYDEATLQTANDNAARDASNVRIVYDWRVDHPLATVSTPTIHAPIDFSKLTLLPATPAGVGPNPTLQDVKTYEQRAASADVMWTKAYDRLQAFRKAGSYADDPSSIDAGVSLTKGSPTTVAIAYFANTYTLTDVVVHQFGRLLLGTWGTNDSPSSVTAAPLKSPWKLHSFGATNP